VKPLHFTITSTAKNVARWAARCIESVQAQTYPHWTHHYVAADEETAAAACHGARGNENTMVRSNPQASLANLRPIWNSLPDDEVVVWLDGDDWLAHATVLERLARAYGHPTAPWLTYGQFEFDVPPPGYPGKRGFAAPYGRRVDYRRSPWLATHLKTFRAGLAKRIDDADLKTPDGRWVEYCTDRVTMLPMLEMAAGRYAFIEDVLCIYNYTASFGATNRYNEQALAAEEAERQRIHAKPRYRPLRKRPW
jgi:glycosyltransferase involved in cell wall biosynthesis